MSEHRVERDSMGDVNVPARAYYARKHSARSKTFQSRAAACRPN